MIYTYTFTQRALVQYDEAYRWYWAQSEKAAESFKIEIRNRMVEICMRPMLYRNTIKNFREANLKVFPFTIVFRIDEKKHVVVVTSIFHNKRNPKGKYTA